MTRLSTELQERADTLSAQLSSASPTSVAIQVIGGIGLGKTTFLHGLSERLAKKGLRPIHVSPPLRAEDTGPAIIVQIGDGLRAHGLANGESDQLRDPAIGLEKKLATLKKRLERKDSEVVLLCDEPREWERTETENSDDHYTQRRKQRVLDAVMNLSCRRVFAGNLPQSSQPKSVKAYVLPFDSVRFGDQVMGSLEDVAQALRVRLNARLARATSLERRLLAAFAKAASVDDAVSAYAEWPDCWMLARRLANAVSAHSGLAPLREIWARLALFRGAMDAELLRQLGVDQLELEAKVILDDSLLQPSNGGFLMHDVLKRLPRELGWHSRPLRQSAHEQFADYFAQRCRTRGETSGYAMVDVLEGFHHAASAGRQSAPRDFAPFFVEQLHTLGRVLSKQYGNHEAAIQVFEQAIRLDDQDDYAHHYVAYNVDWLALDEDRADCEYKRAVELNKEHPCWWSRRINFLITTGRLNEARQNWSDAKGALGLFLAEDSGYVYRELHLWVARLLLHRGQLDFADLVLASVPEPIRRRDTQFQALGRLYETLREAERGRGVFPWSVPPDRWWHTFPNLSFPPEVNGEPLMQWNPARVEDVDEESVWMIVGSKAGDEPPTYGHVAIPRSRFDEASLDVKSQEIEPDRFLELAFYGARGELRIRCHPVEIAMDGQLPGFDPPNPRRYLKQNLPTS